METKQLATAEALSAEKLNEFLEIANIGQKLPANKRKQFIEIAQAYGLNPFKREIYCVGYGDQTNILTGYEVYIKRAERTGQLDGWDVKIEGKVNDKSLKAIITIYRKDWKQPFVHEVYYIEACQYKKDGYANSIWAKMPRFMTKKVAIAQGFRLCFSDELGGMPYTQDEMPQEEKENKPVELKAEVINGLTEEEKAKITNAKSEQELKETCNALLKQYPAEKKELVKLFNDKLAELKEVEHEHNI